MAFGDIGEIEHALDSRLVTLHSQIKARIPDRMTRTASWSPRCVETTPGRMMLAEILPQHPNCRSS